MGVSIEHHQVALPEQVSTQGALIITIDVEHFAAGTMEPPPPQVFTLRSRINIDEGRDAK